MCVRFDFCSRTKKLSLTAGEPKTMGDGGKWDIWSSGSPSRETAPLLWTCLSFLFVCSVFGLRSCNYVQISKTVFCFYRSYRLYDLFIKTPDLLKSKWYLRRVYNYLNDDTCCFLLLKKLYTIEQWMQFFFMDQTRTEQSSVDSHFACDWNGLVSPCVQKACRLATWILILYYSTNLVWSEPSSTEPKNYPQHWKI